MNIDLAALCGVCYVQIMMWLALNACPFVKSAGVKIVYFLSYGVTDQHGAWEVQSGQISQTICQCVFGLSVVFTNLMCILVFWCVYEFACVSAFAVVLCSDLRVCL